jgi:ABC-type ATPase with predicted acetyltransferase domain
VSEAVRWLAAAGLAEATLYVRRVGELSDGQRQRFVVARGLALAWRRGGWVCVDEFAAGLDGLAGWALTRTLAREVGRGRGRLRVALATSDERVLRWVVSACGERGVGVVVREMVRGAGVECGGERGLLAA